jgi:murein DD-endopeptidase MepM/ murein hydrolase activator NlpD
MPDQEKGGKGFRHRIRETYRLVILKDETLREVSSFRLTLLNLYVLTSTLILIIGAAMVALIIWTPLKKYVPGYGEIHSNTEFIRVNKRIAELEKQIDAYEVYIASVKRVLAGKPQEEDQLAETHTKDTLEEIDFHRVAEDDQLRQLVELKSTIPIDGGIEPSPNTVQFSQEPPAKSVTNLFLFPPIKGDISLDYQPDIKHYGIDILAPANTPVKSVMDGIVIVADWTLETGNTIGIQHPNNLVSFYKHNSALLKKIGTTVKAGEAIAIIGNTGTHSDGPHLHFELWQNGKPINPRNFIDFR